VSAPLLAVEAIAKAYGGVQAVRGVSLHLAAGELLALIGPNGAGKSTCFNMLNGQVRPDSGSVRVEGRDVTGLPPRRMARLGVGRTFQITRTFLSMTVRENVQVGLLAASGALLQPFGFAGRLRRADADRLLDRVGLTAQAEAPCGVLAYGDLKRLELAVALAGDPKLLLMDEPTAGMAPRERADLMRLAAEVAASERIGVLFTEHDMDVVFDHASRVMVLDRGAVIAQGPPAEVRRDARVRAVYLGTGRTYDSRHAEPHGDAA
jgi:branched-chain amino acid transport system ATP-binding protein